MGRILFGQTHLSENRKLVEVNKITAVGCDRF